VTQHSLGKTWVSSRTVTDQMVPGHLSEPILSTPALVALVEEACLDAVQPSLNAGETTVGSHVCISHRSVARVGETLVIESRLAEIDRHRLIFDIVVRGQVGVISEGTHARAVVTVDHIALARPRTSP
jgi:fluoroacetyl-CoA thioesterase